MSATMGNVPQPPKKPVRSFRVEDKVWSDAMAVATARGESLGDVIRKALVAYVKKHQN